MKELRVGYAQLFKNILPKPFLHQVRANIGTLYVEPDVEEETPKMRPSMLPKKHSPAAILQKFLEEKDTEYLLKELLGWASR